MKSKYLKMFSDEERELKGKLDVLFREWKKSVGEPSEPIPLWFIPDGFYPNYLSQKIRILYIGRDAYDLYGTDDENGEKTYIEKFIRQYVSGVMYNTKGINRVKFHKMLIRVAYGLIHGCSWDKVPYASNICDGGKIFEQESFAFMNLCKWSHGSYDENNSNTRWNADWDAINRFVEQSVTKKRNFILEEIDLLKPDVIITMNFGPELIQRFSGSANVECLEETGDRFAYSLTTPVRKYLILDPWHFSSINKSENINIYTPLLKMLKKHL